MIEIINKEECCGCYTCVSICPKNCISMKIDEEGFWYPEVNKDICIQCGLCEKKCPVIQNEDVNDKEVNAYVAYSKNEKIRMKSSSGGLFAILAEEVLSEGGVVFGAAFNNKFLVHHVAIESMEDLKILQGSKYLQSEIGYTYKEAKKFLKQGRKVLFSGTACQIAGLKSFLGKDFDNLFTIDVLCHGVPSPKVWEKYINEKEKKYNASIKQIEFRNKTEGWKKFSVKMVFDDSQSYRKNLDIDDYMKLFLSNICLRPSCHNCKFKSLNRPSDITLGDCWGIENYMPNMDDDKGTSVVLTHSEKGREMLLNLTEKINLKEAEVDKVLSPTADSRKSVKSHCNRKKFFKYLNKDTDISKLVKLIQPSFMRKCIRKIKKIISLEL
ncbi:MAG: Coenzyme F420 hydrogenase/dehydrogenase, beta subunit C-terminal domain [Clostridium sp.]|nr:Coenzyme F420 hydrogenase/dehydrogenase, beta subunit C-terminal domain [Clostridium sp.]